MFECTIYMYFILDTHVCSSMEYDLSDHKVP